MPQNRCFAVIGLVSLILGCGQPSIVEMPPERLYKSRIAVRQALISPSGNLAAWINYNHNEVHVYRVPEYHGTVILNSQDRAVKSFAFSPDSKQIAIGNYLPVVTVWQLEPKKETLRLTGHSDDINVVKYSPEGDLIASGSHDKTVRVWNSQTGQLVRILRGHADFVKCLCFLRGSEWLVSGGHDGEVRLWSLLSGKSTTLYKGSELIVSLDCRSDGRHIAFGTDTGQIGILNVITKEIETKTQVHDGVISSVQFHPNEPLLATASWDKTIKLMSLNDAKSIFTLGTHDDYVFSVDFSPAGDKLITSGRDNSVRIWQIQTRF